MNLQELDLQLTLRCNLACGFCSVAANRIPGPELSLSAVCALIDEARDLGMEQLHLTGGEPCLREDLEAIVAHAAGRGVAPRIITNGTLLTRDRLARLQDLGLGSLMVSIDGLETEHDAMRGRAGSWRRACQAARWAVELGLTTRVSAAAFQRNLAQLPALMSLAAGWGVEIFSVFLGSPLGHGQSWQDQVIPAGVWRDFLADLGERVERGELGASMAIIAEQGFCWSPSPEARDLAGRGAGCSALASASDFLLVRADGALFPCVFFMHEGPALGQVGEEPLAEILARLSRVHPYEDLARLPEGCEGCGRAAACGGGCRGYAKLYRGAWEQPDPRCSGGAPAEHPLCPIAKLNLRSGRLAGSSELALD